ncbi:pentatricopeptide repeat-containing protein At2g35030, mitochondrial-like [Selaginella moellendorffii]|uniref:pentatricopeptide repeat-containing protein At2g35030, mitochondrial-like n=1 Tax=Selaginella moellendorffii TaxID=88036 RepID=UPI000D1C4939|nr:pentatricopeptide repeat-containing protein At2g35030, mitochondrial-like [Selaginella moellendorffii]|eukprot:XP_024527862.1 pentatricopeptide repeat-containing protein At2g35030, mitochondrial-like [Selaginella moellendorffii]
MRQCQRLSCRLIATRSKSSIALRQEQEFVQLVRSCTASRDISRGRRVHAQIWSHGLSTDVFLCNALLHMYGECGSVREAREIFDGMDDHSKNRFSWITMLTVYAHNGRPWDAKNLFDRIPGGRDSVAWSCLIGAFVKIGDLEHARHVFDLLPRWTVVTSTAILVALAKRGKPEDARAMFLTMPERDLVAQAMFFRMPARNFVSWNAIIDGCAQGQDEALAKKVFDSMPQREVVSWTAMVATYSQSGRLEEARALLSKMPALNIVSWNVMIQAFADNLLVEDAKERFDRAPEHDFVSWNAIITAYAQTSQIFLARAAFDRMPQRDVVSWATMIQSYAQEGQPSMDQAKEIFDRAPQRNVVSWNVMITGYSASGRIKQSRGLFERMPMWNLISWTNVIVACTRRAAR